MSQSIYPYMSIQWSPEGIFLFCLWRHLSLHPQFHLQVVSFVFDFILSPSQKEIPILYISYLEMEVNEYKAFLMDDVSVSLVAWLSWCISTKRLFSMDGLSFLSEGERLWWNNFCAWWLASVSQLEIKEDVLSLHSHHNPSRWPFPEVPCSSCTVSSKMPISAASSSNITSA